MDRQDDSHSIATQSAHEEDFFEGFNLAELGNEPDFSLPPDSSIDPQLLTRSNFLDHFRMLRANAIHPSASHSFPNLTKSLKYSDRPPPEQQHRAHGAARVQESYQSDGSFRANEGVYSNPYDSVSLLGSMESPSEAQSLDNHPPHNAARTNPRSVPPIRFHPYHRPIMGLFSTRTHRARLQVDAPGADNRYDQIENQADSLFCHPPSPSTSPSTPLVSEPNPENTHQSSNLTQPMNRSSDRQSTTPCPRSTTTDRTRAQQKRKSSQNSNFGGRTLPEHDLENREIMRLRTQELLQWPDIVKHLNELRQAQGRTSMLTEAAVYGRFVRNSARIASLGGIKDFDPHHYMHLRKCKGDLPNTERGVKRLIEHSGSSSFESGSSSNSTSYNTSEVDLCSNSSLSGLGYNASDFETMLTLSSPAFETVSLSAASPALEKDMPAWQTRFSFSREADQALQDAIDTCHEDFWSSVALQFNTSTGLGYDRKDLEDRWYQIQTQDRTPF